MALQTAM
jgi:HEPN domain-containing protein